MDQGGLLVDLNDKRDVFESVLILFQKLVPRVVGATHLLDQGLIFEVLSNLQTIPW